MDILSTIAERKICEAMERGELDNLPGAGKPLAMDEDLSGVPAELRMAYKILKNAGFVPPEVELRKEIVSLREMLGTLEEDEQRRSVRRQLDYKLLKLNMIRKRPLDLDELPEYRDKIVERLGG
jgi:DnaJ-like protein